MDPLLLEDLQGKNWKLCLDTYYEKGLDPRNFGWLLEPGETWVPPSHPYIGYYNEEYMNFREPWPIFKWLRTKPSPSKRTIENLGNDVEIQNSPEKKGGNKMDDSLMENTNQLVLRSSSDLVEVPNRERFSSFSEEEINAERLAIISDFAPAYHAEIQHYMKNYAVNATEAHKQL